MRVPRNFDLSTLCLWSIVAVALAAAATACGGSSAAGQAHAGTGGTSAALGGGASSSGGAASANGGRPGLAGSGGMPSSLPCIDQACPDTGPRPTPLPRPKCPESAPVAGDPCTDTTLYCSYGDSPAVNCRHAYQCTASAGSSHWEEDPALIKSGPCVQPTAQACPSAPMPRTPCDMASVTLACQYPGLVCQCVLSSRGGAGWQCLGAPENPACPEQLPNVGEGCTPSGLECDYAVNSCDPTPNRTLFCFQGAWEPGQELGCTL